MLAKESITVLVAENKENVAAIRGKIEAAQRRLDEVQQEIQNIREKELPEAVTKSVLEEDSAYENKVLKTLAKLEEEAAKKQKELAVYPSVLENCQREAGLKAQKLHSLFSTERKLEEQALKSRLMHAKYQYVKALEEAGPAFQELNEFDVQLQLIEYDAGLKNSVYSEMPSVGALRQSDAYRYEGVYLGVSPEVVNRILKGKMPTAKLEYLKKFSDPKNL